MNQRWLFDWKQTLSNTAVFIFKGSVASFEHPEDTLQVVGA